MLMVKPQLENRDGARIIRSRSGLETECVFAEELEGIDLTAYDCVIVDEAQFLTKAQVARAFIQPRLPRMVLISPL